MGEKIDLGRNLEKIGEIGNFRIFLHEFPKGWRIYTKTWGGERIPRAVAYGRDVQLRLCVARDREV